MQTAIHIGPKIDKDTLEPLTNSILRVLDARADQETIRRALDLLGKAANSHAENLTISDCNIDGSTHEHHHYPNNEPAPDEAEQDDDACGTEDGEGRSSTP